ncbi:hypothetical protein BWQ96_06048 [Gracilariopsis chorda]|uniref:Uncharacterized protein n=1 Tax=Gracilariopsis chorda TaxID=448386 RepID=A0A2V3IQ39_9FLOR|nr:hypothetical protein BWQ96_06048 [Gracilariopsis chorda]|eukprot:PXF44188.1 hypothetical protein BWQ96_06048 [Gracilariopsis chorda]
MTAFCAAPLPALRRPRQSPAASRATHRYRPRLSAARPPSPVPTPPPPPQSVPPPPLPPPPAVAHNPFLSALYRAFSTASAACFENLFEEGIRWDAPFLDAHSRDRVLDLLDDFFAFAVDPTIAVYQVQTSDDETQLQFNWTLSFNYPLPWRPRVSASGVSSVTLSSPTSVEHIKDEWYTSPATLITQSLPRVTDMFWLYPSPHSETDRGQRKMIRSTSQYSIIHQAPCAEYRVLGQVEYYEHELIWAMPAIPKHAFEGGLRKLEQYSAVSPVALRLFEDFDLEGDRANAQDDTLTYQWALPVPTTLIGSSDVLVQFPMAKDAHVLNVPRRLMAVARFKGFSTRTEVQKRLKALVDALVADNVIPPDEQSVRFGGRNVWVRGYECKVGFNSKGVLSMAMYGGSKGVPRVNEIAIDLTELVNEQDICE